MSERMIHRSYVLKGSDAQGDLAAFVAGVTRWLVTAAPLLGATFDDVGEDDTGTHVWSAGPPHDTQLYLATEGSPGVRYFTVGAPKKAPIERIEAALTSRFSFWSVAELTQKADASTDGSASWIVLMTIATNKRHDAAVQAVIERYLASTSATLRHQAALSAGLVRWPELRPVVAAALGAERDGRVRTTLAFVLDQMGQRGRLAQRKRLARKARP